MIKLHRLVLASALTLGLLASAQAAVESFTIDPVHSSAGFAVRHMVSKFNASFTKVTGTINVDRENLEKSSVTATVDVASLNTANDKRDAHVKSPDFLDFAKFPAMSFTSTSWKKTGEDTYDVAGKLTIKDVTKDVTLKVTILGCGHSAGVPMIVAINKCDKPEANPLKVRERLLEHEIVVEAMSGDVQGSAEAIVNALNKISNDEIKVKILNSGVGAITESDVSLAQASGAPIIGFNVRPNAKAREMLERHKVRMKYFDVIYHLTEDISKEMAGVWGPERIETVVGRAEVKEVFPAGKHDKAAGLLVVEGYIKKGLFARLTRQDVIVSQTHIKSLRRFKDDVAEVRAGLECGVVLEDTNDIKPGDHLETFEVEMRDRVL